MKEIELIITYNDENINVIVEYEIESGSTGARGGYGEPLEPDYEPDIEILSVLDQDGAEVTLSNDDIEIVKDRIIDNLEKERYEYRD